MEWNGMEWNGMEWNGMEWNGLKHDSPIGHSVFSHPIIWPYDTCLCARLGLGLKLGFARECDEKKKILDNNQSIRSC
jgi:hypothetical protein